MTAYRYFHTMSFFMRQSPTWIQDTSYDFREDVHTLDTSKVYREDLLRILQPQMVSFRDVCSARTDRSPQDALGSSDERFTPASAADSCGVVTMSDCHALGMFGVIISHYYIAIEFDRTMQGQGEVLRLLDRATGPRSRSPQALPRTGAGRCAHGAHGHV